MGAHIKPRLDRVSEVANSTARVLSCTYVHRGYEYKYDFRYAPLLLWEPVQKFLLWITPSPKKLSGVRTVAEGGAAIAFEDWTGREAESETDFALPGNPLRREGVAGRIVYRFERAGDKYWHHDFSPDDSLYVGANERGPRVFAVTGPNLRFTDRGIIN